MERLGITQRSNAGVAYRWLRAAGLVSGETGKLTSRGRALLSERQSHEFRQAARAVLDDVFGASFIDKAAKTVSIEALRQALMADFGVSRGTANKALVGGAVLARDSGDPQLTSAFGRPPTIKADARRSFEKIHGQRLLELETAERSRIEILEKFRLFTGGTGGIDSWLSPDSPPIIFTRLAEIETESPRV